MLVTNTLTLKNQKKPIFYFKVKPTFHFHTNTNQYGAFITT